MQSINSKEKTWLLRMLAILALLCIFQAPAVAQMWDELFEEHMENAQGGDADAQYEVGIMYLKGQGVEQNREKAISWLNASAKSGNAKAVSKLRRMKEQQERFKQDLQQAKAGDAKAQYDIAMMYLKGRGVEQDGGKARTWLSKAADQKDEKAITRLGILNYKGEAGEKDYAEALKLFKKVKDESVLAQYYLGDMYAEGKGVSKDYEKAIVWYKKAAKGGFDRARGKIINMEEELKMLQRRNIKLAQAQKVTAKQKPAAKKAAPKPAQAKAAAPQTKKKVAKKAPKKVKLSALDKLAKKQWLRGSKPVDYLPSKVTSCEKEDKELVCFSEVLKRESGNKTVEYRVKSVIQSEQNRIIISYKSLVLDVVSMQEIDDEPIGYDDGADDAAVEQGYRIKTGWTKQHKVECKPVSAKGLDCMKDQTHAISLVGG